MRFKNLTNEVLICFYCARKYHFFQAYLNAEHRVISNLGDYSTCVICGKDLGGAYINKDLLEFPGHLHDHS